MFLTNLILLSAPDVIILIFFFQVRLLSHVLIEMISEGEDTT